MEHHAQAFVSELVCDQDDMCVTKVKAIPNFDNISTLLEKQKELQR
jgi:hypothetical protein